MAGFRVLWANEFDPDARMSYKPNHPDSILDSRNICDVTPSDVLAACKLSEGELDLFDGSPPCQTFSTAGKRNMQDDRTDLFMEYARLVQGIQPKTFVAENVSGMVKGVAKGQFKITLQILRDCGYRVECRLLDAQWLGVPQQRQRVIFIGMRNDLELDPVFPKPLMYRYSVRDAIPWIIQATHRQGGFGPLTSTANRPSPAILKTGCELHVEAESALTEIQGKVYDKVEPGKSFQTKGYTENYKGGFSKIRVSGDGASPTISTQADLFHPTERRKFTIAELKRIGAFPDDFELVGSYAKQWARVGNSVPPLMMRAVAEQVRDSLTSASHGHDTRE